MNELVETLIRGLGLGGLYSLIAVGFVIIFRSTGVLNFAQPVPMILGTYLSFTFVTSAGLPFWIAALASIAVVAAVATATERIAMRPMVGRPAFSATLVTVGLFAAGLVITTKLIDPDIITSGDPWGLRNFCLGGTRGDASAGVQPCIGGITVNYTDIFKIVAAAAIVALLGLWLHRSRYGLAMRATAMDQEAAMAQGISAGRVFSLSWALAGGLAAAGGILLGASAGGVASGAALVALKALPAVIIGGLDSIKGAAVGSVIVGLAEALTKTYQPDVAPWLGANFDVVLPYVLMFVVLLVQPYGLYGTREVRRV